MRGITNAPQGGGGGEWVYKGNPSTWADLFTQGASSTTALYTCLMIYRYNDMLGIAFITKGQTFTGGSPLSFKCSGCHNNTGSNPSIDVPDSLQARWNEMVDGSGKTAVSVWYLNE